VPVNRVAQVVSRAARPAAVVGTLRELLVTGVCAACYPFGLGSEVPVGPEELIAPAEAQPRGAQPTPVLLLHGFGHNRSGWMFLERHLRRSGFSYLTSMNYSPLCRDIGRVALELAQRIDSVRAITGARRVHLIGHSLGGIVIRYYVQLLGGDAFVHTAVTIASPHEGTLAGHLLPSPLVEQLHPESWVIRALDQSARPSGVNWVAYYSDLDALVQPAASAMLRHPALGATNLLVKDHGHLSMLLSPGLGRSVAHQLAVAEGCVEHAPLARMG
jgi:pimeloyl-ACP methyl ester carboxylesterase